MTRGKKIKEARKNAGLSQKELAKRMGVSVQMISMYETDQRNPKFETLKKLANALGVKISELTVLGPGLDALFEDPDEIRNISYIPTNQYEVDIMASLNKLNVIGKAEAAKRIEELTHIAKYAMRPDQLAQLPLRNRAVIETTSERNENNEDTIEDDDY